jgi:CHAT domain-containing protein
MRQALIFLSLLLLIFGLNTITFAQSDALKRKLDSLKAKDNLSDWITERMAFIAENPQQRLAFSMDTQKKLWRNPKSYDEHYIFLDLLSSQGYDQLLNGNILGSISSYEAALTYYYKHKVVDYEIAEFIVKPLSNNYTRLGDFESALNLQQRALNFLIKTHDKPNNIATHYCNMAISYHSMGNYAAAEKCIMEGLKIVGPNDKVVIMLNNILADIWYEKGEFIKAAKLIEANIGRQKNINKESAYWLMSAYTSSGNIHLALHQINKADDYYRKAIQLIEKYYPRIRLREKANILTKIGRIKLLQNQPLLALQFFHQTLATLKITDSKYRLINAKIYGDNKLIDVFEQMATAYQKLNKTNEALKYIKLALFVSDKIRNEFGDNLTKERLQADLKTIAERGIEICYQSFLQNGDKQTLQTILALAEQTKSRTLLDQIKKNQQLVAANLKDSIFTKKQALERAIIYHEKQDLENNADHSDRIIGSLKYDLSLINKQIKSKYHQFNFDNDTTDLNKLLSALPNQNIIEYFVGKNAVYIIAIKNKKVETVIKINDAELIKRQITNYATTYFQNGPNAMLNAPKTFFFASNQLYKTILAGIKLSPHQRLIIIPDGEIGYLSFDGLITSPNYQPDIASWPFLIKNNIITYAFSLKTLLASKPANNPKNFTGLFITHQNNSNTPLKEVQEEAAKIKKVVNGNFLMDEEANVKSFNKAFEESKILHIGTHSYLSGKNKEPTLAFDQEKLFLFELAVKKSAPSLVVLSACRTADGLLANGEGIISLSRGFNAIGTPATIAGLWNVNDNAASIITSNFYQHLINHKSTGEALHQAKIDWLSSFQAADALYLPYYWDSLIYMGADQTIVLNPAKNWWLLIGIGGTLLIVTGIFIFRLNKRKFKSF